MSAFYLLIDVIFLIKYEIPKKPQKLSLMIRLKKLGQFVE